MGKVIKLGLGFVVILGLFGLVAFAYIWISGGSGEASEEISAPTLEVIEANDSSETSAQNLFRIVSEESEVRFALQEDLRGQRTDVIGRTNQVAGDVLVDTATPANSQIGTIRINLRTLQTDNESRNRAIRGQILNSADDRYEFGTFEPTRLEGLPQTVTVGESFSFTIIGNLTVRETTREVSFNAEITPLSQDRITGSARAEVLYRDFGLSIPSVPSVANVTDEVSLEIDFVAVLVDSET